MKIKELYHKLIKAYSEEKLNTISSYLISLYRNRDSKRLLEIASKVSKYIPLDDVKDARCFSSLIMLYHPDRGAYFRKVIRSLYEENDLVNLASYGHILEVVNKENLAPGTDISDIDYHPQYEWDGNRAHGYRVYDREQYPGQDSRMEWQNDPDEKTFYDGIKIKEYGRTDIEFPPYYLEDFEEFEMVDSGLVTLDGIEHCTHVRFLDLSDNAISDLSPLWGLVHLEELYLGNNQIGFIDALSNLVNLKVLDLTDNPLNDISALLDLEGLEFVNLIGCRVPEPEITRLRARGTIVITA